MWGVCLDNQAMDVGLFRAVIRYEIDHLNNTVVVTLPKTDLRLCVEKIKQLPSPPKFVYGSHEQNSKRVVIAMVPGHGRNRKSLK